MKQVGGFHLEAFVHRESSGSAHYRPGIRVNKIDGHFSATHMPRGLSFDSHSPASAMAAALRYLERINSVRRIHA